MDWICLIISAIGLGYLVYSILCRNRVTYYNRREGMQLIKPREFYKLQLHFAIANSVFLIVCGIIFTIAILDYVYLFICVLIFHLINFLFRVVSKNKGYVNYN